ncbi:phosphate transporter [Hysterangium stoloniferum]|nr:phosphate transporter [Hysterangium stoloniferum]
MADDYPLNELGGNNNNAGNHVGNNIIGNNGGVPFSISQRRMMALAEVDEATFNRFHFKVCFVVGVGFFTDAYDLFAIDLASVMIGNVYGNVIACPIGTTCLTQHQDLAIKVASPVGTLIGQLLFGWFADIVGRKRMYGVELGIIIVTTFFQAIAGHGHAVSIVGVLVICRFLMGIGIGGDYPLSAVITSEFAATRTRGRLMTGVFSMQGWGQFTAAVISTVVVVAFRKQIQNDDPFDPAHVDFIWRLIIGLGCIPGAIALYSRLTIPETPRFTMDIERNVQQAAQDVETFLTTGTFNINPDAIVHRASVPQASRRDFRKYFGRWDHAKILVGAAYSWFALDIAFYGLGLNNSQILSTVLATVVPPQGGSAIYQNLLNISVGHMIISVAGLIPGYYATFFLIDSWGRKPIQLMGFIMLTILFLIMGFGYNAILNHSKSAFVFLYCLANFFQNFGPNTTTFIIPGESFPTRYRSTAYGISAACGKLGAIVAQVALSQTNRVQTNRVDIFLKIFAFFMLSGIFSTLLIPETKGRTLEDISGEAQESFIQGL